jgi:putative ATP-binding cassette transporter
MKCPPDHQRCCGEDPGASGRNFTEKLSRSTKTARKTKAAHSRRRPVFAKKSPARLQETVQHLSLSSALDHVIALAKSLSPTHGHFVGVSRKRPASAHHWLDLGAMSVGEIAQITAAFVVVLVPLNWLVDNCSGLADCLSSANQLRSARAPE